MRLGTVREEARGKREEGGRRGCEVACGERRDVPSRSMSCSCAMLRMSSPSLASTVFSRLPFESLKWTLILHGRVSQTAGRDLSTAYPVPGAGRVMSP